MVAAMYSPRAYAINKKEACTWGIFKNQIVFLPSICLQLEIDGPTKQHCHGFQLLRFIISRCFTEDTIIFKPITLLRLILVVP